jgi:ubiquinone/menaquinone biosynthesis C-methylase UbiE
MVDQRAAHLYDRFIGPLVEGVQTTAFDMYPPWEGMRVLDVGCGTGAQLSAYADAGCRVSCVDVSPGMLSVARRRLGPEAELREGSGTMIPFADDAFDLATISFVLHEVPLSDRVNILQEMRRVVKSDGRILVIDFLPGPYRGLKSRMVRVGIVAIELAAGRDHWRNHRDFLRRGGLESLTHDLTVRDERPVGWGTLSATLLGS